VESTIFIYLSIAFFSGGGEKKIASEKLDWKSSSKVGSTDNMKHKAGGGNVKVGRGKHYHSLQFPI
jgi:hypothetical protein